MLQTAYIRENKEKVLEGLAKRNFDDAAVMIERVLELDDARRSTQNALDTTLSQQNALAKEIGDILRSKTGVIPLALQNRFIPGIGHHTAGIPQGAVNVKDQRVQHNFSSVSQ